MKSILQLSGLFFVSVFLFQSCLGKASNSQTDESIETDTTGTSNKGQLSSISLPPGFTIEVYAANLENARSIARSETGILYVGTRDKGDVYAIQDTDGDHIAEKKWTIATGLKMPNGVACKDGDLYVAEIDKIHIYPSIDNNLENPKHELFLDGLPDKEHHGWKYIAFGPDGDLYVPVGAPCNICESKEKIFASISKVNLKTKEIKVIEEGVRNTVGFTWHPETKELWFTDNGGDWLGDDMPACELNYAPKEGMHFGYPYCHQGDFLDPKLGAGKNCDDYTPPVQKLDPHVAPLGVEFYKSGMFPAEYSNKVFIAEHGSWNSTVPVGYRITMVTLEGNKAVKYEPFATGWLNDGKPWGRPVDLEWLPDGSLLVSDDGANQIYRISYKG